MANTYPLTSQEWLAFAWRWALWMVVCVGWCFVGYVVVVDGSPIAKLFGLVFGLGAGITGLLLSFPAMKRSVWLNSHGEIVEGYVKTVSLTLIGTFWPVYINYNYTYAFDINGENYESWSTKGRFFWRHRLHEGDLVEVIYDPRNPKVRKIKRIKRRNI